MMKVAIITCFQSNEERVNDIKNVFESKGAEVKCFTTDFSHLKKEKRNEIPLGFVAIPTIKYKKNISIARLLSHKQFVIDVFFALADYQPDLIWVEAPCNSLIKQARKYKTKDSKVKIVIDMIDMWPESLPIVNKNFLPLKMWKTIRTNNLKCAAVLVSECNYYLNELSKEYDKDIYVLPWSRSEDIVTLNDEFANDRISLCYLGSINNIIDIDLICSLIKNADKKVDLHIIGSGEKKDELINKAGKIATIIDHGNVYDSNGKKEIFSKCLAGLNTYKEGLYIGLTVKSIDYMQYGLPIINNIKGDTFTLIEKEKIGLNVDKEFKLCYKDLEKMRLNNKNIYQVFNNEFSNTSFKQKLNEIIAEVLK